MALTDAEFEALLATKEGETIDFKAASYDLSSDHGSLSLVKDVVCMANTPREGECYIVLGVKKHADGSYKLWGLDKHPDEAALLSQFTESLSDSNIFI